MDTLKEKQSLAKTMLQDGQEILEGRFMIVKKLGSGAFGEIYKGKYICHSTNFTTRYIFVSPSNLFSIPQILLSLVKNWLNLFKS